MKFSTIWYWKLAIWKLYVGLFLVTAGALPSSIMNWYQMNQIEKIIAIIGLLVVVHKFADAFIDQTVSRLMQGKPPVAIPNGGDTTIIKKAEQITITDHRKTEK